MTALRARIGRIVEGFRNYQFEFRHLTILVAVLIIFQLVVSYVHRRSLQDFLTDTQRWYQQDSAERLANLTTMSLELLFESQTSRAAMTDIEERKIVQNFNIIFSQQLLHQDVQEVCLLIEQGDTILAIDDGHALFDIAIAHRQAPARILNAHPMAIALYKGIHADMRASEQIRTVIEHGQVFNTFVPFVPRGEYVGAMYVKNAPDFSFITRELISGYNQTTATYLALILFGLIAMFYVSSYTLRERNRAQHLLFEEQKVHLAEQIRHQNELLFTKRIYHTHHKAEKIMGFIKEDLRNITAPTMEEVKHRVTRYSNFIARVIYDMKWYDPPLQTIRGPGFRTDANEVLRFIVDHVFRRVAREAEGPQFVFELDSRLPPLPINEFVMWEVLEPIIQNALDHAGPDNTRVVIRTTFDPVLNTGSIRIADSGKGIEPWLLERGDDGIRKIFKEQVTTKNLGPQTHAGYGCYLAYEIAKQRCGWELDADNCASGGCEFIFRFRV